MGPLERSQVLTTRRVDPISETRSQPDDQSNSVAWLLWHMSRVVDNGIHTRLQSQGQLWVLDVWHQKFGLSDEESDFGMGWTAEQVAAWQAPSRDILLGYYEAVKAMCRREVSSKH